MRLFTISTMVETQGITDIISMLILWLIKSPWYEVAAWRLIELLGQAFDIGSETS